MKQLINKYWAHFVYGLCLVLLSGLDEKVDLHQVLTLWTLASVFFLLAIRNTKQIVKREAWVLMHLFSLPFFFEPPYLSNDYFRFFWDGELWLLGISPFDFTPNLALQHLPLDQCYWLDLHGGMGELSNQNHSCYPIFNQFLFVLGVLFSDSIAVNLVVFRVIQVLFLFSAYDVLTRLLRHFGHDQKWALLFVFNPLVLVESIGNVHFEMIMVVLLLWSIYFLLHQKLFLASVFLGLAIHTKLLPLILLPFALRYLDWKKTMLFSIYTGLLVLLLSIPLLSGDRLDHFIESVGLYFGRFEFNSFLLFPYLEYGEITYGWNLTNVYAPRLSEWSIVLLLGLAFYGGKIDFQRFLHRFFFGLLIYFAFTSTVHPWYWVLPLGFAALLKMEFILIFCFLSFFSYGLYVYGFRQEYQWGLWTLQILGIVYWLITKRLPRWQLRQFLRLDSGTGS